ncbi:hypothetical protein G9A89_018478 [Geosiphon pyriformis]|nr:hypothetical protein G9A89_018478 [Geosiphon pyriformis]
MFVKNFCHNGIILNGNNSWQQVKGKKTLLKFINNSLKKTLSSKKPVRKLENQFEPSVVEKGWYAWWEAKGFFEKSDKLNNELSEDFIMLTPPPNVTGNLHIGHALTFSLQDAIVRWRRMSGSSTSWIPGTDHAGIGTQSVVERYLQKEKNLTRRDFSRDTFVEEVWKWRKVHGDRIIEQLRRLGASLSWKELFFTMDAPRSKAVTNAFVRLYEDGLIYRATRLVNWCCVLETVLSDIEVEYKTISEQTFLKLPGREKSVEFGVLHKFAYQLADESSDFKELVVATTRIETLLADCAVAVHPDDPRYKSLHGKEVIHPLTRKRLPIISDAKLVDMEFGTGVVKISPGHDQIDYECAQRHNLPVINVFNKNGSFNNKCQISDLINKDRFDVRNEIIDRISTLGLYRGKEKNHQMRIALCSRTGDVIEQMLHPQWYIRCKEMANRAIEDAENQQILFYPSFHKNEWNRWLENTQDWCVSRQLWWGHPIPAYKLSFADSEKRDGDCWIVAASQSEAEERVKSYKLEKNLSHDTASTLKPDEDVLDTWFSSALLPLSALSWTGGKSIPANYPTSMIETGSDILCFWIARMTMLCTYFAGKPPFKKIFLHPMVRDAQGRKMSKSLGNVIDPLNVIDGITLSSMQQVLKESNLPSSEIDRSAALLAKQYPNGIQACGTDALRFTLIASTSQTHKINLDVSNVVSNRHFVNKIWNLFKLALQIFDALNYKLNTDKSFFPLGKFDDIDFSLVDRYILSRLAHTVASCENSFDSLELHKAANALKNFIWEDLCDIFIEFAKPLLYGNRIDVDKQRQATAFRVLEICLDTSMRLIHPFMPFISEELWQHLNPVSPTSPTPESLMIASYPKADDYQHFKNTRIETDMQTILGVIHASRSLRQKHHVPLGNPLPFTIWSDDESLLSKEGPIYKYLQDIKGFTKASSIDIVGSQDKSSSNLLKDTAVALVSTHLKVHLPMSHIAAIQKTAGVKKIPKEEQLQKLMRKLDKVKESIMNLKEKREKPEYTIRVPENVKAIDNKRMDLYIEQLRALEKNIELVQST